MRTVVLCLALVGTTSTGGIALANTSDDAGVSSTSAPPPAGGSVGGCVETLPKGARRPTLTETFPERGTSGWAATLAVTIRHGRGERVLPSGLDLSSASDARKYLKEAGFVIPTQAGAAGAVVFTDPDVANEATSTTHLEIPLVTLPDKPGRSILHLPPLPVAIARANGEIATVCTAPHTIVVEDPTANVPDARPKPNPPARAQREEWTALKKATLWGGLGILAGAVLAYLLYRYLARPKPIPPPPPPRPPWEVALERLEDVRHAGLLEAGRHAEYFDRVNDAVRSYFGARFGFDGLESTTDEILDALRRQAGGIIRMPGAAGTSISWEAGITYGEVEAFLAECDLVKFANLTPSPEQCDTAIVTGERFIRLTSPLGGAPAGVAVAAAPSPEVKAQEPPPPSTRTTDDDAAWKPPAAPQSERPTADASPPAAESSPTDPPTSDPGKRGDS